MFRFFSVTLALLLSAVCSVAMPPDPNPKGFPVPVSGQRVFAVGVTSCQYSEYWILGVFEGAEFDSLQTLTAAQAIKCGADGKIISAKKAYPVLTNSQGELTYAVFNGNGKFVSSSRLVGLHSPFPAMENIFLPEGEELADLETYFNNRHRWDTLDDPFFGDVEADFLFCCYSNATFQTVSAAGQLWTADNWYQDHFGSVAPITPLGQQNAHTMTVWYDWATNQDVNVVPGTHRWPGQYPQNSSGDTLHGILNQVSGDSIIPWLVPYTREDLLNMGRWQVDNYLVDSICQANGINSARGNRHRVLVLVWLHNWNEEQWASSLWPHAYLNDGFMVIGSNYGGDINIMGVTLHEFAHAAAGVPDAYLGGYNDSWNPMTTAVYNFNGRRTPGFAPPDMEANGWVEVNYLDSGDDVGVHHLAVGEVMAFRNPTYPSEVIYAHCVNNTEGYQGLLASDTSRVLFWHLHPGCNQYG